MRIIQITSSYKPAYLYGGPTISTSTLFESLSKIGSQMRWPLSNHSPFHLEVLTTTANGRDELNVEAGKIQEIDGVKVTYYKRLTRDHSHFSPALLWSFWKKTRVKKAADEPYIIHIHGWWNLVSVLAALMCNIKGAVFVFSPRGMLSNYSTAHKNTLIKKCFHNVIGKRVLNNAIFHVTSKKEEKEVKTQFPNARIYNIPNIINLSSQLGQPTYSKLFFRICFLSRINRVKGLELIFQALKDFPYSFQLVIAGDGEEEYIESLKLLSKQLNISTNIKWVGHLNEHLKFTLLKSSDILVLTSYTENFANVVIESLSVGTAVVLSDQVGTSDFVQEYNLGWVCKPESKAINESLKHAFYDDVKRKNVRENAPKIIQREFSEEALLKKYLHIYEAASFIQRNH